MTSKAQIERLRRVLSAREDINDRLSIPASSAAAEKKRYVVLKKLTGSEEYWNLATTLSAYLRQPRTHKLKRLNTAAEVREKVVPRKEAAFDLFSAVKLFQDNDRWRGKFIAFANRMGPVNPEQLTAAAEGLATLLETTPMSMLSIGCLSYCLGRPEMVLQECLRKCHGR